MKVNQLTDIVGKERTKYRKDKKNYTKIEEKIEAEYLRLLK